VFCAECGTESVGGKFCTNCGKSLKANIVSNDKNESSNKSEHTSKRPSKIKGTLSEILQVLENEDARLLLSSLVNIESGDISFRTTSYPKSWGGDGCLGIISRELVCEEICNSTSIGVPFFVECSSCARSPNNYFWIKSGDGDGLYVVFEILKMKNDELVTLGFIVVCAPTSDYAQPLVDNAIANNTNSYTTHLLKNFEDLPSFEITKLHVPKEESLYITDKFSHDDHENAIAVLDFSDAVTTNLVCYAFSDYGNVVANTETEVMRKAISEAVGYKVDLPDSDIRPRVIIGIDEKFLKGKSFSPSLDRPSGKNLYHWWQDIGVGSSHIEPAWETAIYFSAGLAEIGDNLFETFSWLLQGARNGDKDCLTKLREEVFSEYVSDITLVVASLRIRGQFAEAGRIEESGKLPEWLIGQKQKFGFKNIFRK
jgi:hypothetical protein